MKNSRFYMIAILIGFFVFAGFYFNASHAMIAGGPDEQEASPTPTEPFPPPPAPTPEMPGAEATTPIQPTPTPAPATGNISLRLTAIGDVNFNRNRQPVMPNGVQVWDRVASFESFTAKLAPLVDGEVNFANIETVITDRNDFSPPDPNKAFCFRSHPNGVRQLLKAGFNLFSLANNHAFDYGATGVRETLKHLNAFAGQYKLAFTGIGMNFAQASQPAIFTIKGVCIGMVAVGIGTAAGPNGAGVAHVGQYRQALARLRDANVDLRILSCHDGKEGQLVPIDRQLRYCREAIRDFKVNLVLGHHPHRVQGVERYLDGAIYYSLGNGLMRGAADIGGNSANRYRADFGLMARVNLEVDALTRKVVLRRLEAVPLYRMHEQPEPSSPDAAARRLQTLNDISTYSSLQQNWNNSCPKPSRTTPLHFTPQGYFGFIDL